MSTEHKEYGLFLHVKRPTGEIEIVNVDGKMGFHNHFLDIAYEQTLEAGRGEILKMVYRKRVSNIDQLRRQYNDGMNEGGEGYVPEDEYFKNSPRYKEWDLVRELTPN